MSESPKDSALVPSAPLAVKTKRLNSLPGFNVRESAALLALAEGKSTTEAAIVAGVTPVTVASWRQHYTAFKTALQRLEFNKQREQQRRVRQMADDALAVLHAMLTDVTAPHIVRLKAAQAVLKAGGLEDSGTLVEPFDRS